MLIRYAMLLWRLEVTMKTLLVQSNDVYLSFKIMLHSLPTSRTCETGHALIKLKHGWEYQPSVLYKWKVALQGKKTTFEQRCHDLEAFKSKFGHYHVPFVYSANPSLAKWCSTMRFAYYQIQQGQTPNSNLTPDQIERLGEIGFRWKLTDFEKKF